MSSSSTTAATVENIDADELFRQYEANEVAADSRYKNQRLLISGRVSNIGKDILDTPYLELQSAGRIFGVQAMFSRSDETVLAGVSKGQEVAVDCLCTGKLGNVIVKDCRLRWTR